LAGLRILVVDDEPDACELVRRLLTEAGARVTCAASGAEALDRIHRDRPAVLLSDIGMPDMDGYEFLRQLRARSSEEGGATPAAAVTAFARADDRERALAAGYQGHITQADRCGGADRGSDSPGRARPVPPALARRLGAPSRALSLNPIPSATRRRAASRFAVSRRT